MRALLLGFIAASLAVPVAQAAPPTTKVIKLEGISIQGNSEEPQVMYITPWQEPPGTGRLHQPATSFRQQWLHTIDDERLKYDMALPINKNNNNNND